MKRKGVVVRVSIVEITRKMTEVLKEKGIADADIPFVIETYLGGELQGHLTHGLASFPGFVKQDFSGLPEPEVVKDTQALFMVDAKGNTGSVVARRAADEAIKRAKSEAIGTAIVKNMDVLLRPGALAKYIAGQGYMGIVIESGGAANMAPPGGYDPVIGTNPIGYGIPTSGEPLVVDMALSKQAYGNVRLAKKYGKNLPENTFYTDKGEVAVDPEDAHSVMPAGDHKGFALSLLFEILCGSTLGMPMMIASKAQNSFGNKLPDRGCYIIVIDPKQTSGGDAYAQGNSELIANIKKTRALPGQNIRIPGEQAAASQAEKLQDGVIEIPDELWQEISNL